MYKSDYKKQKEFENLIINGTRQEVLDYYNYNSYSVSVNKNKFQSLYNLARKGDVELFKELFTNRYGRSQRYNKLDVRLFAYLLIKNRNLDLLKEIILNLSDINFKFYMYLNYEKSDEFRSTLYSESLKKDCPFEIFEFILQNVSLPYKTNIYITTSRYEWRVIEKLIENSRMDIFEEKIIKLLEFRSDVIDKFIEYCVNKNRKNYIMKYLYLLDNETEVISLLTKLHKNTDFNLLKRFKNINGISIDKAQWLDIVIHTKNKALLKEAITNASKKYRLEVLFDKIAVISKENFNCFLELNKKEIDDFINENTNNILYKSLMSENLFMIRYILKISKLENFDSKLFYNCTYLRSEIFFEVMKDKRFHKDTEDFKGLNILIKYNKIEKLDFVLKIPEIRKGISDYILRKLFNDKEITTLKIIINNIKKEELENYELLPEGIKSFFKIKSF